MNLPLHGLAVASITVLAACDAAVGPPTAQDGAASIDEAVQPNVVVFEFSTKDPTSNAQGRQNQDNQSQGQGSETNRQDGTTGLVSIADVLAQAEAPQLARLVVRDPPDEPANVNGTLLFADVAALVAWRQTQMEDFLTPMGGADEVETTIRLVNRELLDAYGLGRSDMGLENLSVTYTNADNASDGDADIDAVTVVCPGDFADCSPSN